MYSELSIVPMVVHSLREGGLIVNSPDPFEIQLGLNTFDYTGDIDVKSGNAFGYGEATYAWPNDWVTSYRGTFADNMPYGVVIEKIGPPQDPTYTIVGEMGHDMEWVIVQGG